jgi:sugar phosphate permease
MNVGLMIAESMNTVLIAVRLMTVGLMIVGPMIAGLIAVGLMTHLKGNSH